MKKLLSFVCAVVMGAFVVLGSSCARNESKRQSLPLIADAQKIISTRPQTRDQFMLLLKLKSPAALTAAQIENGVTTVDQDLLKNINTEQDAAVAELKKISSEIQIIYRYKLVLNGLAIIGPMSVIDQIKGIGLISSIENNGVFSRPKDMSSRLRKNDEAVGRALVAINERNSSKFIGAEKLNLQGITGKGISVGIIDTGIDYTHAMFKGVGTADAYKAINPSKEAVGFPNDRVVGGVDLVGTVYDSAGADFSVHIPKPDLNPLDEGGHGTHVAGTVAGLGDGLQSYNGMAPEANLYAIKVFGAEGSTSDIIVIAALEYAADPNGDGMLNDQLDIVNLSLGSSYGNPHILYSEAMKHLVNAGTVAVISAGNEGPENYIVGAPGTATEALSVAASIDNTDQNWKFNSSVVMLPQETLTIEAIEAATTKSIEEAQVAGSFYYIGLADKDLSEDQKTQLQGKIALIDRGSITFNEKIKRAIEGGAIGAVVINNKPDDPFKMGTTDDFAIPAVMISQAVGQKIKAALASTEANLVKFSFLGTAKIEKPELVDTLTSFSSKGPRSIDGFLKPEISAPGNNVISAAMGKGSEVVQLSGTSMAAPHMAGVMALLKQAMKKRGLNLTALELKNIAMGTSATITENGERYPVTRQGAGRIQADKAAEALVVASKPSVSFGEVTIETKKTMRTSFSVKNISTEQLDLTVVFEGSSFVSMTGPSSVSLAQDKSTELTFLFTLDATQMKEESVREMDGWIKFMKGNSEIYRVPMLAMAHRLSAIVATGLKVSASGNLDGAGAAAILTVKNQNQNAGEVLAFNLLALDERKPVPTDFMNADCDLQAVGYKIIQKGQTEVLQIGVKTFKPMTTWNPCNVSVLFDSNGDGVAEQELLGGTMSSIPNMKSEDFRSVLIDAAAARELRHEFEEKLKAANGNPDEIAKLKDQENYETALIEDRDMKTYNDSTVLVVEADTSKLVKNAMGQFEMKVVLTHNEQGSTQADDFLAKTEKSSIKISGSKADQGFMDLGESVLVSGSEAKSIPLTKGAGQQKLMVLFPQNKMSYSDSMADSQMKLMKPQFGL